MSGLDDCFPNDGDMNNDSACLFHAMVFVCVIKRGGEK